ncbi:hypothetical protein TWF103_010298 [Orbilia oligospora]|nr:hypothetical protein TWF103_010298 [Orbilia oligospora]
MVLGRTGVKGLILVMPVQTRVDLAGSTYVAIIERGVMARPAAYASVKSVTNSLSFIRVCKSVASSEHHGRNV